MSYGATWWCGAEQQQEAGRSGGQIPHMAGAFLYGPGQQHNTCGVRLINW